MNRLARSCFGVYPPSNWKVVGFVVDSCNRRDDCLHAIDGICECRGIDKGLTRAGLPARNGRFNWLVP